MFRLEGLHFSEGKEEVVDGVGGILGEGTGRKGGRERKLWSIGLGKKLIS